MGSTNACAISAFGRLNREPLAISALDATMDVFAVPITRDTSSALRGMPCDIAVARNAAHDVQKNAGIEHPTSPALIITPAKAEC